jgi:hypothetical protein
MHLRHRNATQRPNFHFIPTTVTLRNLVLPPFVRDMAGTVSRSASYFVVLAIRCMVLICCAQIASHRDI